MKNKKSIVISLLVIVILVFAITALFGMTFPGVIDEQSEIVIVSKVKFYEEGYAIVDINSSYTDAWLLSSNTVRLYPIRNNTLLWLDWELLDHIFWKEWKICSWIVLS